MFVAAEGPQSGQRSLSLPCNGDGIVKAIVGAGAKDQFNLFRLSLVKKETPCQTVEMFRPQQ
jgi:hypothetical protein